MVAQEAIWPGADQCALFGDLFEESIVFVPSPGGPAAAPLNALAFSLPTVHASVVTRH